MNRVFMVAGRRTSISPKGGALANVPFHELAATAAKALMADADVSAEQIDGFFLGNALAAGGNPARVAALASGLPYQVPAWSIDTQCSSGLDAISLAVDRIRAGNANVLLAGGAESASQAPQRSKPMHVAKLAQPSERELGGVRAALTSTAPRDYSWVPYDEADFTPWSEQEPSMVESARALSGQLGDLEAEYAWAVRSHERARASIHPERIGARAASKRTTHGGSEDIQDAYTRALTAQACQRAASHPIHNPTTMAPLADGAAMVLLMSERALDEWQRSEGRDGLLPANGTDPVLDYKSKVTPVCEVLSSRQAGADPFAPGLSTAALKNWLDQLRADHGEPACLELMESFAAQAILNIRALALDSRRVNVGGGLLAMGHPIGASGAVLVARLHHRLRPGEWGAALIPAAGGLASGIALWGIDAK